MRRKELLSVGVDPSSARIDHALLESLEDRMWGKHPESPRRADFVLARVFDMGDSPESIGKLMRSTVLPDRPNIDDRAAGEHIIMAAYALIRER